MSIPCFSILLPTKNRSEILAQAIESALGQTFSDLEVIVSDNDDSDTATANIVKQFVDPRLKYVRTNGKLAMHENWDNAFLHAQGKYVLVLEDKMRLVPNALEILNAAFESKPIAVITYGLGSSPRPEVPPAIPGLPRPQEMRTDDAINEFCNFTQKAWIILPKGLNSCAPRSLLQTIKENSPTGYLFSHLCPDYALAFMTLSKVDSYLFLSDALSCIPKFPVAAKYSNGEANYTKSPLARRFMRELPVSTEEFLSNIPVKSEWLWINPVLYDFFTKYKRPGAVAQINWVKYFAHCIALICIAKQRRGDTEFERSEVKRCLKERGVFFAVRVGLEFGFRAAGAMIRRIK